VQVFSLFRLHEKYVTEAEKAKDLHTWKAAGFAQTDEHPVVYVTWNDAKAFCAWLNRKEPGAGAEYRLPTEAQWEYACRAGSKTRFSFGDDENHLKLYAHFGSASTKPVGSLRKDEFGLYDMLGNSWQLCEDKYGKYPEKDETDPVGPQESPYRVFRGGGFYYVPRICRSAYRNRSSPAYRYVILGFRVARVPIQ
jgi:formylglycine-generating enzyme required for sulfatase activity